MVCVFYRDKKSFTNGVLTKMCSLVYYLSEKCTKMAVKFPRWIFPIKIAIEKYYPVSTKVIKTRLSLKPSFVLGKSLNSIFS